jgi:hypothetical protein
MRSPGGSRSTLNLPERLPLASFTVRIGEPATDIWLIEAKIKSGESSDQLQRYQQEAVRDRILNKLGFKKMDPVQVRWRYLYLTLEGEKPPNLPSSSLSRMNLCAGKPSGNPGFTP